MYVRMRHRVTAKNEQRITIGDVAQVIAHDSLLARVTKVPLHQITTEDHNVIIIDVMKVISVIRKMHPNLDIQTIGPPQTIIQVDMKKHRMGPVFVAFVWFLLFIGAGLALMNFHEDVSMREVQIRIFQLITGNEIAKPLLLQIPYSIGLGLGMIIFFNHLFRKRINEEPSPLELEMFNYQQNLDQYVSLHENKESIKKLDGD
ncbi:stage V sporulation protein AA [Halalkalibacter urbisdiaboli]|uniref:stage V sporulation protein AA n=1 Tax=Halalkalibacter urbisdiaboli TaxID=1960589 RepID=UPI000B444D7A|nr:stage V sporulation protein AA [Halalkalibacter urbisdiaboli]